MLTPKAPPWTAPLPRPASSTLLPIGWSALLATVLAAALGGGPLLAELTASGNLRLEEDDFDLVAFGPGSEFGYAVATCDFDGDGFDDLAIGSPGTDVGLADQAGAVYVAYGSESGLDLGRQQTVTQPAIGPDPIEEDDRFGRSLAGGDFNGDGWCDLAVGVPEEDFGGLFSAGTVHVFHGSATGLGATEQIWSQDSPGVFEQAETNDRFGFQLAAGNFNGDAWDDLAITARGENDSEGAVHVLLGSASGLSAINDDLIFQGDPLGTTGFAEVGEAFGLSLAVGRFNDDPFDDLAIGVPFEDAPGMPSVGWTYVLYGGALAFFDRAQDTFNQSDFGEEAEAADQFGWSLTSGDFDGNGFDDLAVSAPAEELGPPGAVIEDAGSVSVLLGTATGLSIAGATVWTQDSPGIGDQAEADDDFGTSLAAGDFDGDGADDLGIGVTGESLQGIGQEAGALHAIYGSPGGLTADGNQFHGQDGWNVGPAQAGSVFPRVLATGDFDGNGTAELVAGTPFESSSGQPNAGSVSVLTGGFRFADGFESGDLSAWTLFEPCPVCGAPE